MNAENTPKYVIIEEAEKQVMEPENHKYFVMVRSSLESPEAARCSPGHDYSPDPHSHHESRPATLLEAHERRNRQTCLIVGFSLLGAFVVLAVVLGVVLGLNHHSKHSS